MNIKTTLTTGALVLGLTGLASAQVTRVYITGSTAIRNSIYTTLDTAGAVFDATPTFIGYGSTTSSKCTYMAFSNTISSQPYIIKCEWSGSEAGIIDCVSNTLETFPADSLLPAVGQNVASATATPPSTDIHANDFAMADNNQAYSRTTTPSLSGAEVCVIPFEWVKNAQIPADQSADWLSWTNITLQQANVAETDGGVPLSMFTGNEADTNFVYIAGRNNNSGTRANGLLNMGLPVNQFVEQIYITGGSASDLTGNTAITLENQGALAGPITSTLGTDGQNSGGTLATTMTYLGSGHQADVNAPYTGADIGWYAAAYLGLSDAASAVSGNTYNAVVLNYNGEAPTFNNVVTGIYPYWGNEWTYQSTAITSGGLTVLPKLQSALPSHLDNVSGIPYSSMHVYKSSSAAFPTQIGF
jgi:hypothetical protein